MQNFGFLALKLREEFGVTDARHAGGSLGIQNFLTSLARFDRSWRLSQGGQVGELPDFHLAQPWFNSCLG